MPKGNREAADCLSTGRGTVGVPLNAATMLAQAITLYKHGSPRLSESRKGELEPLEKLKRSERELHSTIQTARSTLPGLPLFVVPSHTLTLSLSLSLSLIPSSAFSSLSRREDHKDFLPFCGGA